MKLKLIFLFILASILWLTTAREILSQHFESPSYIIDWGNFNITSGRKNSTNYWLTDTVGQNAPGAYTNTGYTVKSGFQYIYNTLTQFSFTIDDLDINLGSLVAGVASTASNTISITTPSGHGYQVMARYNHPLSLVAGTTIPDTSCDSGTCTPSSSGVWSSSSTYGFGFNALGINSSGTINDIGTSSYFATANHYRPFSLNQNIIMAEDNPVNNHSARITYKSNISSTQAAGNYQNAIIFTAVPKY